MMKRIGLLCILLASFLAPAVAQIEQAIVQIDGMF